MAVASVEPKTSRIKGFEEFVHMVRPGTELHILRSLGNPNSWYIAHWIETIRVEKVCPGCLAVHYRSLEEDQWGELRIDFIQSLVSERLYAKKADALQQVEHLRSGADWKTILLFAGVFVVFLILVLLLDS